MVGIPQPGKGAQLEREHGPSTREAPNGALKQGQEEADGLGE